MRLDSARFITHSSNALAGLSGKMLFLQGLLKQVLVKANICRSFLAFLLIEQQPLFKSLIITGSNK
jgi:hypothetical protein